MNEAEELENIIKARMTKEAWERYSRVKLAHEEAAQQALAIIAQLVTKNNTKLIDEQTLKGLLTKIKR